MIFLADDVYKKYMIEFMRGVVQNLAITPPPPKKKTAKKTKNKYSIFAERYHKIGCSEILNVYQFFSRQPYTTSFLY